MLPLQHLHFPLDFNPLNDDLTSMLLPVRLNRPACRINRYCHNTTRRSSTERNPSHDPLRILFCGADDFSIYSLRALHALQKHKPDKIASIDVVCRPDKRVGRGLKQIQQVPIKTIAEELGLPIHQLDTFTKWSPPTPINLIVAVSFGLLVPARLLNGATYGGLNVHPSLLPDLRGAAPIQHALLKRRKYTGVSVQTMHPKYFDQGSVLAQTPTPGIEVPKNATVEEMIHILGPLGAQALAKGIDDGVFVPPIRDVGIRMEDSEFYEQAPKITPEYRRIDWDAYTADDIVLRDRVLGRLWDNSTYNGSKCIESSTGPDLRVTFKGPWLVAEGDETLDAGIPFRGICSPDFQQKYKIKERLRLAITTQDYGLVSPTAATIEGGKKDAGVATILRKIQDTKTETQNEYLLEPWTAEDE